MGYGACRKCGRAIWWDDSDNHGAVLNMDMMTPHDCRGRKTVKVAQRSRARVHKLEMALGRAIQRISRLEQQMASLKRGLRDTSGLAHESGGIGSPGPWDQGMGGPKGY